MRTRDVDFQFTESFSGIEEIHHFAAAINGHVYEPSADEATPELAKVVVPD